MYIRLKQKNISNKDSGNVKNIGNRKISVGFIFIVDKVLNWWYNCICFIFVVIVEVEWVIRMILDIKGLIF